MPAHRRRPRLAALAAALTAAIGAIVAVGAEAEPAPSFPELLRQAQTAAPRLDRSRAEVRRAAGLADQAAALPNPTVGIEVENLAAAGRFAEVAPVETTVSVAQAIELGGKRAARAAAGRAGLDAARAEAAEDQAQYAYDLAAAYLAAEASERRLQLARDALAMAEEDARAADALVRAGKEADVRSVQARAAVQSARAAAAAAEAAREAAFAALTALAGSPRPFTSIAVSLLAHGDVVEPARRIDPLQTPAYRAALAAQEAAERRVRAERSKAVPDVTASLGLRQVQGVGGGALVAGLSAPLPLFDRNRGNVAAASAELAGAAARTRQARLQAEADLRAGQARVFSTEGRLEAATATEDAAVEAYRLTRLGYEAGKTSLLELQSARRALSDARAQSLDTRLERLDAEAALARLQGAIPFGDLP